VRSLILGSLMGCLCWWLISSPGLVYSTTGEALYEPLITTTARGYGLDPALVKAVVKCESGFNPWAQSPKGAQGLMQLMPSTQTMLGVSNPFHPQHNVEAGARYLAMLKQTFSGDERLALAAYNAGPQAVIAAGYTVPAMAETQQYVRCVFAAYEQYRQPGTVPFLPGLRPLQPGTSTLPASPRSLPSSAQARQTLVVSPLRLSSQVAQVGQRLTVELEAINTSKRPGHGIVMLNYPEHLVSFMALHTAGQATTVQLPASPLEPPASAAPPATAYQLLWSHWPVWTPGERRTAIISLVPRLPQDLTLHVSVVLDDTGVLAASQRWSSVVRIPFRTAALVDRDGVRYTPPRQ
jgi:transglycosylase-like protein with SLT domain